MNEKRVPILFEDMSYHTEYRFLEMGKDDNELKQVAEKAGIVYPSPDIAIFKGRYALVDKQNRNRCTLPKEEVEKALDSLRLKAVDIDHLRRYTVGSWLYGYMDGNEVITYGAFWKSNYPDEYKDFKNRMASGKGVDISMEAWGNRINKADNSGYSLVDIHFAGGALLDKESPAEPSAGVLEFAKIMENSAKDSNAKVRNRGDVIFPAGSKNVKDDKDHFPINNENQARNALARVAQYKSVPKWYDGPLSEVQDKVKSAVKSKYPDIEVSNATLEKCRFYVYDMDVIMRLLCEVINPATGTQGCWEIESIDFENNTVTVEDMIEGNTVMVTLTPQAEDMGIDDDADDNDNYPAMSKMTRKVLQVKDYKKINKSTNGGNKQMEDKVKELEVTLKAKDAEIAKLAKDVVDAKTAIETSTKVITEAEVKYKELQDSIPTKIKDAQELAKKIAERRAELTEEFAKDISDEDIVNEDKYTIAKLKKENASLKKPETASTTKPNKTLEAGSKNKEVADPSFATQKGAAKLAWGPEKNKEGEK